MNKSHLLLALSLGLGLCAFGQGAQGWKAGVARVKITPEKPIWLAGYALRDHVFEGVRQDIWAKALALEDRDGNVGVIVTMDLCFIPRAMSLEIKADIERKHGLKPGQVILNASHTHSGPLATLSKWVLFPLSDAEWEDVFAYTRRLIGDVSAVVGEALARRAPATVMSGGGTVRFAVNRRRNKESQLKTTTELVGPVDHAVPVLKVEDAKGALKAVLFGYACHNTVLDEYLVCGDYAGYAQEEVERMHPGATAMFFQGGGADQNPLPRRKASLAMQYGRELAAAVEQTLADGMSLREPVLVTKYAEATLAMEEPMSAETLARHSKEDGWIGRVARTMASEFAKKTPGTEYPYPIHYWRIGDQKLFALGGELVSGYSREIKKTHGDDAFVMGYCDDVMSYIPTPEMWDEGGYEVATAHLVYMLPAPWSRDVTKRILDAVDRLVTEDGQTGCCTKAKQP